MPSKPFGDSSAGTCVLRDLSQERKPLNVDLGWLGRSQLGLQFRGNLLLSATVSVPIARIEPCGEQHDAHDDDQYDDQRRAP